MNKTRKLAKLKKITHWIAENWKRVLKNPLFLLLLLLLGWILSGCPWTLLAFLLFFLLMEFSLGFLIAHLPLFVSSVVMVMMDGGLVCALRKEQRSCEEEESFGRNNYKGGLRGRERESKRVGSGLRENRIEERNEF